MKGSEVSVSDFGMNKGTHVWFREWINLGFIFPNIPRTNQQRLRCAYKGLPTQVCFVPLSQSLLCTNLAGIDNSHHPSCPLIIPHYFSIIVGCIIRPDNS